MSQVRANTCQCLDNLCEDCLNTIAHMYCIRLTIVEIRGGIMWIQRLESKKYQSREIQENLPRFPFCGWHDRQMITHRRAVEDRRDFADFAFNAVFGSEAAVDRSTFMRLYPHFALWLAWRSWKLAKWFLPSADRLTNRCYHLGL